MTWRALRRGRVEVAAVVRGEHAGRTSSAQRIVCHNLGIALHDIYWAAQLLELTAGAGAAVSESATVDLGVPASRLWV